MLFQKKGKSLSKTGMFSRLLYEGAFTIENSVQVLTESKEEKLRRIVDMYSASILRMCYAYLNDVSMAEDATQDTLLKAFQHLGSFVPRDEWSEKAWLMRIAANTCRSYKRSAWFRHVDLHDDMESLIKKRELSPEQTSLLSDILTMPTNHREILLLHYYQDLSVDELSVAMGVRKITIYKRLEKARKALRIHLERSSLDE